MFCGCPWRVLWDRERQAWPWQLLLGEPCHHQTALIPSQLHNQPCCSSVQCWFLPWVFSQRAEKKFVTSFLLLGIFLEMYLCVSSIGFPTRMFRMISLRYSSNIKALLNIWFFYSPYEHISHKCFLCKLSEVCLVFLKVSKNTPQPEKYGFQMVLKDLSSVFLKWPTYLHCRNISGLS